MTRRAARLTAALLVAGLAACGGTGRGNQQNAAQPREESTLWDLFDNRRDPNDTVAVNRYLWNASLEVLNFLPIQSIDPFTGMIVTARRRAAGGPTARPSRSATRRWTRAPGRCRCRARAAAPSPPTPCARSRTRS